MLRLQHCLSSRTYALRFKPILIVRVPRLITRIFQTFAPKVWVIIWNQRESGEIEWKWWVMEKLGHWLLIKPERAGLKTAGLDFIYWIEVNRLPTLSNNISMGIDRLTSWTGKNSRKYYLFKPLQFPRTQKHAIEVIYKSSQKPGDDQDWKDCIRWHEYPEIVVPVSSIWIFASPVLGL